MFRTRANLLKEADLNAVLKIVQKVASDLHIIFESRFEMRPPATCLVIEGPQPDIGTARVIFSTIEPGTLFIDIGYGLHGEWLLRSDSELENAMATLGQLVSGVFRGQVAEDVRKRPLGRLTIRGTVTTESRIYKFTHRAAALPLDFIGPHSYSPYPSVS